MNQKNKILVPAFFLAFVLVNVIYSCKPAQKTSAGASPDKNENTVSYARDISPLMQKSCAPCHFPPDGKKEPLNTYESAKRHIDEVLERVQLSQSDQKFMPFKNKKAPLTAAEIQLLKDWQQQQMPK